MTNDLFDRELQDDMNRNGGPNKQESRNYPIMRETHASPSHSDMVKSKKLESSQSRDRGASFDHLKIDHDTSSMNRSRFRNSVSGSRSSFNKFKIISKFLSRNASTNGDK